MVKIQMKNISINRCKSLILLDFIAFTFAKIASKL